jgi:hypothetical protein
MLSLIPSTLVLGLAVLWSLVLVRRRTSPPEAGPQRLAAARALAVSVGVQGVHFAEEAATGFHERFGELFGLPGMPFAFFLAFNLLWLAIWVASVPGLRSGRALAFFAAWFLAIAGMLNGIAHPLLGIAAGGYFPGVVSSPFIGAAAVWLWLRLRGATRPRVLAGR